MLTRCRSLEPAVASLHWRLQPDERYQEHYPRGWGMGGCGKRHGRRAPEALGFVAEGLGSADQAWRKMRASSKGEKDCQARPPTTSSWESLSPGLDVAYLPLTTPWPVSPGRFPSSSHRPVPLQPHPGASSPSNILTAAPFPFVGRGCGTCMEMTGAERTGKCTQGREGTMQCGMRSVMNC